MTARGEHFPHEADISVPGFGASEAEVFERAALGGDSGRPGSRGQEGVVLRCVRALCEASDNNRTKA